LSPASVEESGRTEVRILSVLRDALLVPLSAAQEAHGPQSKTVIHICVLLMICHWIPKEFQSFDILAGLNLWISMAGFKHYAIPVSFHVHYSACEYFD
jgi:hypothetical protein